MKYVGDKAKDVNITYIGGGSRGWAWELMHDLALEEKLSGNVKLYDIDLDAAKANEIIGNNLSKREEAVGKWNYHAYATLQDALKDADFVVISILPGTFDEMESDVHLPEKYGIYQAVGDTVGPGGMIRALRTVPMYVEIAEAIKQYAPDAWVINYTNPNTVCTRTLYKVFPEVKAFGCCHEVFGTQELLAQMLEPMEGIKDVKREEVVVNVLGINHFTWFDKASYKGMDLFPIYARFVDKYYEKGFVAKGEADDLGEYFRCGNRVKFDLFRRFGLIAAAGDRHLAEFFPAWYLESPELVKKWQFGLTPLTWRRQNLKELREKSAKLVNNETQMEIEASGEEGVAQMKALLGLEQLVTNINIPNAGQATGLPMGAVVESNGIMDKNSIRPVVSGRLPDNINGIMLGHIANQETIIEAAINKDPKLAFTAFINDNLTKKLSLKDAEDLFEEMLKNTKKYLKGWNL